MFVPSGRVHALGAGSVIFEIQQNSDTTYRVFDWNRIGLDGKPRELHVAQSMKCIDFADVAPSLIPDSFTSAAYGGNRPLVNDPLFRVEALRIEQGRSVDLESAAVQVAGVIRGSVRIQCGSSEVSIGAGGFSVLPASPGRFRITTSGGMASEILLAVAGPFV